MEEAEEYNFPNTPQKRQASVFLYGACGSGKTSLAVALMNQWFADSFWGNSLDEIRQGRENHLTHTNAYNC